VRRLIIGQTLLHDDRQAELLTSRRQDSSTMRSTLGVAGPSAASS
jgi:hypothetical protein